MSGTRLVDIILERRKANQGGKPWPANREDLLAWLSAEPSPTQRLAFFNTLYSTAPDWLTTIQDHLGDFVCFFAKPLTYFSLLGLHIWNAYHVRDDKWRNAFWEQVPSWFEDKYELMHFLRQIPRDCLNDSLRRPGLGACLEKIPPSLRHDWMVDLFAANPDRLLGMEVIIALLKDQSLVEQRNILVLLKTSYLAARPLPLKTLATLLSILHPGLFPLFREEFDALFGIFTAQQFEFRTENVLNFLSLLAPEKHGVFFELFQDNEIQFWIAGLAFTPNCTTQQKQLLITALINCSDKHNLVLIIQLRSTFIYLLQLAPNPNHLLDRLTDKELSELLLRRNQSIAEAVKEIVTMNLDETLNKLIIAALKRIFTLQYGEKTSLFGKLSSTFYKSQHELDTLALGNALYQPTLSVKPSG